MPIHDFRCSGCGHVHDELVKWDTKSTPCPKCENDSNRVFLQLAQPNWMAMGAQKNAGPEFIDRFEKAHKKQAEKEKAFSAEHGDGQYYNRAPGG